MTFSLSGSSVLQIARGKWFPSLNGAGFGVFSFLEGSTVFRKTQLSFGANIWIAVAAAAAAARKSRNCGQEAEEAPLSEPSCGTKQK